jgi:hypothetical protein
MVREADVKARFALVVMLISFAAPISTYGATFYVDAVSGSDSNAGTLQSAPWKSLDRVNGGHYKAGDRVLFHAGSRWEGQLAITNSGTEAAPILVDRYGKGAMPRIDGAGKVENVIELINVEEIEVRHLEITNHGDHAGLRRGVLIAATNFGTAHHLVVSDLYIHDINGTNELKETGGILFRTEEGKVPSRFDGLVIQRNIVWKVDRSAIAGQSTEFARSKWYPSLHVVILDNYVEDIGGDGIVPWATEGAVIEHNVVLHCNRRAGSYNAGIWPWSTDNSLFQLNEAAFTHTTLDGEGFDSDYNSRNSHFFYNYSHDNEGGFMLVCTPVKRDPVENLGNTGTVIRHNISRNDHNRIFNLSGADQTTVEDNAIYTSPKDDVQLLLVSSWDGWSKGAMFRQNTFDVAGTAHYGHEIHRSKDGKYDMAPEWGEATDIQFVGNRFFGHNADLPPDAKALIDPAYHPESLNWNEPVFNPAQPEDFSAYMVEHRQWMMQLFTAQFGQLPQLGE